MNVVGSVGVYDGLLAFALLGAAGKALFGQNVFGSTVSFVIYGLLLSFVWVRLGAPDVALAEAAIGAGLTGALLLDALHQFESSHALRPATIPLHSRLAAIALSAAFFAAIALSLDRLRDTSGGVMPLVLENMPESGSSHPVTSVLLNFRAFDTWFELGVLLATVVAASSIHRAHERRLPPYPSPLPSRQALMLARIMLPILGVIGGALVWYGSVAPGGAFQGGAILGAAGILAQIAGTSPSVDLLDPGKAGGTRAVLALGFGAFLLVAGLTFVGGNRLLQYPPGWGGPLILGLEVAATLSIALTLNLVYALSAPRRSADA